MVMMLILLLMQFAPANTGELRVRVDDAGGLPLESTVDLVSEANQVRERRQTDATGTIVARRLPFGSYHVTVSRDGFTTSTGLVEIRSAQPTAYRVTLQVAGLQTQVVVRPEETLLDAGQSGSVQHIGNERIQQRVSALPGRSLPDLVNMQPGWLLEANGVLHPRGAEYQTQYVIDGLPLTDNRSPAYAPEFDADEVRSMSILTGGYPAEYGRKLGGVIEVVTAGDARRGFHGIASADVASFGTRGGDAGAEYAWTRTRIALSGGAATTDRYLDPPVEENYTNRGTTAHVSGRFDHDVTTGDRVGVIVRSGRADFQVPNELVQERVGQRQDRASRETAAQFSYQHIFQANATADLRGMARQVSALLQSNAASTPIIADQDRRFDELYVRGTVSAHRGRHELKFGGDISTADVHERFGYTITDPHAFDDEIRPSFDFEDRRRSHEFAGFAQDQIRLGQWSLSAGLRWDAYRFVVRDSAFSPRLGVAWSWPGSSTVVRASYDRAFQTPAFENLLLASSAEADTLNPEAVNLPVPPSRGNFYEAGVSTLVGGRIRVDASFYDREMNDFADDEVLLNTGVSFPITFAHASIRGAEFKVDVRRWRALSGSFSYALMRGTGRLPITGGLLLDADEAEGLESDEEFAVTQDQRHTIRAQATYQAPRGAWLGLAASYGSGLPFEFSGDLEEEVKQYGPRILERVNLETGRVRPRLTLDATAGITLGSSGGRTYRVQADVRNLTNQLAVINFSGVFSGTALAPPRSVSLRFQAAF